MYIIIIIFFILLLLLLIWHRQHKDISLPEFYCRLLVNRLYTVSQKKLVPNFGDNFVKS